MKIIITGASGMLGRQLYRVLSKKHDVFGLAFSQADQSHKNIKCDITNLAALKKVFQKIEPDLVIHSAAFTKVDDCEAQKKKTAQNINAEGSINISKLCKEYSCPMIFISTDYVFNGKKRSPYKTSDRTNPINFYGKTKLAAEDFIKNHLSKYYIIRTSWLYGKHGKNFVDTIVRAALLNKNLRIVNDQTGSPTFVNDLALGIHHLIQSTKLKSNYGIYHVTNQGYCTWFEFAAKILKIKNIKTAITPVSSKEYKTPAKRPKNLRLDSSDFNKATKKPLRSWQQAVKDYLLN